MAKGGKYLDAANQEVTSFASILINFLIFFQSFLGFRQSAEIDVILDGSDSRKLAEIKTEDGKKEKHYLYYDGETVSGTRQGAAMELVGV